MSEYIRRARPQIFTAWPTFPNAPRDLVVQRTPRLSSARVETGLVSGG
ncbi:MAG: hypothetical protein ACJ8A6_09245 [Gemmatimonadales bacterium]